MSFLSFLNAYNFKNKLGKIFKCAFKQNVSSWQKIELIKTRDCCTNKIKMSLTQSFKEYPLQCADEFFVELL